MVSSRVYPGLERKPGGPDNWVEATGGLPDYIDRIAKHLVYEQGFTISHAIATAVNTVKRWAHAGKVVKYNDPNSKHVTVITAAQAAKAVAEWEAKKARARTGAATPSRGRISLSSGHQGSQMDLAVLVERANRIEDPVMRGKARQAVLDLAVSAASRNAAHQAGATMPDKSFPIRNAEELKKAIRLCGNAKDPAKAKRHIISRARALGLTSMIPDTWDLASTLDGLVIDLALTKDGRKSFKNTGGKFKHGFIPLDNKAKVAKAKGSPIAMKRMNRLFGGGGSKAEAKPKSPKPGQQFGIEAKKGTGTERAQTVGQALRLKTRDATDTQKVKPANVEVSRGRRPTKRSNQAWEDVADDQKVIRGGKRYVLTSFGGRQSLTEWVGPGGGDVAAPDSRDKVMTDITPADLKKLTTAAIRRMLEMPGVSDAVRKILNKELARKERLGLVGGKTR